MIMKRFFCFLILLFFASAALTEIKNAPLPADQAFQFSATAKDYQTILLKWNIAPNYYLYQKNFSFHVITPKEAVLGEPLFPNNTELLKTSIGNYAVYSSALVIPIPLIQAPQNNVTLHVQYQGCSKSGYCYPPITKIVRLNLKTPGKIITGLQIDPISFETEDTTKNKMLSAFQQKETGFVIVSFFVLGVLISLTPCILPMIPILSKLILGKEKITHAHAFLISLFYVLGMSITYAIVGVIFAWLGTNIQAFLQMPWVIASFILLLIAMALSSFGLYNIQLPEKFQNKIIQTSHHQKRNSFLGAFVMGCLSTLILSPCVTPPLVATLAYISQTANLWLGSLALFSMGMGVGTPLLLMGALGPRILPKTGAWMNTIKNGVGVLLLMVALLMSDRILPAVIRLWLWTFLWLGVAIHLSFFSTTKTTIGKWIKKIIGFIIFIYGILLFMIGNIGNDIDPWITWKLHTSIKHETISFQSIKTIQEVETALQSAKPNQVVMLDFYADWCIACKEWNVDTFSNPRVQQALANFKLLRADVTQQNTMENRLLQQHFNVIAPPTILFFRNNQEIPNSRIVGYQQSTVFLKSLEAVAN